MKRLVFCFDGTSNRLIGENPTNVVLTAESVQPTADDGTAQLIFYDEGVGTTKGQKVRGLVFGKGLNQNLADAYRFLIFNYTPGDQIYIFGSQEELIRPGHSEGCWLTPVSRTGVTQTKWTTPSRITAAVQERRSSNRK